MGAMAEAKGGSLRAALSHRDYRLLLPAFGISTIGDWLYGVSLVVLVYNRTHSAGWVAAVTIIKLVPYVAFGAFGGIVADRYERRNVMLICDLVRALLMFSLAISVSLTGSLPLAFLIAFLTSTVGTAYQPATFAITPAIVGERDLAAANAVSNSVDQVAVLVGPAIGGFLLFIGPPSVAIALNGLSFLASAACVWAVQTRSTGLQGDEDEQGLGLKRRLAEGFNAIRKSGEVSMLVVLLAAGTFVYGQEVVMLVLISKRLISTGSEGVGFLNAAEGFGGIVVAGFSTRMARTTHPAFLFAAGVLATGVPLGLMAFVSQPTLAYALIAVTGGGCILLEVTGLTMLQRNLSSDVMGRVFGVMSSLLVGSQMLGSLVTPLMIAPFSLRGTLVVTGLILPVVILFALPQLKSLDRASTARMRELAGRVETLGSLRIFEGAAPQVLESIASVMTWESVQAGTTVVREGEAADDFFVVLEGELDVVAVGEVGSEPRIVNSLGPDDYFGEIGLLEGIPRTASVRARTPATLYRIPSEEFLGATNRNPGMATTLFDGIVGRLARTHPSHEPKFAPEEAT
jgi:CRP-like cAMP-binding protein/MFS family permease